MSALQRIVDELQKTVNQINDELRERVEARRFRSRISEYERKRDTEAVTVRRTLKLVIDALKNAEEEP